MRHDRFERLFEEHAESLLGFLVYRTGDRALAEDLLADTFERVLRARRRFDPRKGSEKTWLYSIAVNLVRDHQRRQGAETRALEQVGPSGAALSHEEEVGDRDAVMRGIQALSEEERDAIAMRFGADLSVPEISKLSGEKLTTVEGRVYRALRKLREELG
jgi:RNA polymerase sigma factor (sigma-70 family)